MILKLVKMAAFLPLFLTISPTKATDSQITAPPANSTTPSLQFFPLSMDAQEYCKSSIRSSKKRGSGEQSLQQATANKRAVLGDTTNSLVFSSSQCSVPDHEMAGKNLEEEKESPRLPERGSVDSERSASGSGIYRHLRSLETESHEKILANSIEKVKRGVPSSTSTRMREILVDWLVEVADEYELVSDTLYLTVSLIDRYLSSHDVHRDKLQLLGVCCMHIASKHEDISPPHIEDFCYITDNTYTKKEVMDMEREVNESLSHEVRAPTIKIFLRIFTRVALENWKAPDLQFEFLSCYLAELSLLDCCCAHFSPSIIAASAIFLSRFTILPEKHPWSSELQCYSGYRPSNLMECIFAIHDLQLNRKGSSLKATREKYKQHKFNCVAVLSPPSVIPAHYFEDINKQPSESSV